MKRCWQFLAFGLVLIPASMADGQPSATSPCDAIADVHLGQLEITDIISKYPLPQLSKGPAPIVEVAGHMGRPAAEAMEKAFHPEPDLAKVFARYGASSADFMSVQGFPGSTIHAVMSEGGSDACQTWVLFDAPKNGSARVLPALPQWLDGGLEDSCEPHWGALVRVKGQVGFLKRDADSRFRNFDVAMRFAPLVDGKWAKGCHIKFAYPIVFTPKKIFTAPGSPLTRVQLERTLPKLMEAKWQADQSESRLRFSDGDIPALDLDQKPVTQVFTLPTPTEFDLPQFGVQDAEAGRYKLAFEGNTKLGSVRLDGRSYVVRSGIAKSALGVKALSYLVIFYNVDAEKQPSLSAQRDQALTIASAIVEFSLGAPSVSVSTGE